jgi:hypothetical protein
VRAAQILLGAPTIGGGSAWAGGDGGGVKGVKYAPKLPRMYENGKNRVVSRIFGLKITENAIFNSKVVNKKYSRDVF